MSVTQKPLPGADSKHFLAISYPLDWEKTHNSHGDIIAYPDKLLMNIFELAQLTPGSRKRKDWLAAFIGREETTLRVFDPPFGDFLAIDRECARSTPASKPLAMYG